LSVKKQNKKKHVTYVTTISFGMFNTHIL